MLVALFLGGAIPNMRCENSRMIKRHAQEQADIFGNGKFFRIFRRSEISGRRLLHFFVHAASTSREAASTSHEAASTSREARRPYIYER